MASATSRNRAKGQAYELAARKYLERKGYFVHQARQSGKQLPCFKCRGKKCQTCKFTGKVWITNSNDILELFDLEAHHPHEVTLWVQVTSNDAASPRRKKILEQAHRLNLVTGEFELWRWGSSRVTERTRVRQQWTAERLEEFMPGQFRFRKLGFIHIEGGEEDAENLFRDAGGEAQGESEEPTAS